jgi:anti-anti-sigma factor
VVIDLTGVEMVDSAGLSALIDVRYCVNNSSSKLIVINASEDVCGVFKAIGLDRIFTVVRA